jgi:Glycosyltransferases involved in cell wall biogenesis
VALEFSLVIPTYNERENLPHLFAAVSRSLKGREFEIILVDDDSPDKTWAAAEDLQKTCPFLQVIRRRSERGLSSAVICGFRRATGKFLGVMDADLQHDENRLPELLMKIQNADFAIATRRAAGGNDGKWCWSRRLTSAIATTLAKKVAHISLSDPMSGFFVMRRALFEAVDDGSLKPRGYKVLLYLYARCLQRFGPAAVRLAEVGYQFRQRQFGRSKLSSQVVFEYLAMLFTLRAHARGGLVRGKLPQATSHSPCLPSSA